MAAARKTDDALSPSEARASAILALISDDELDALAVPLARLLLSAAKRRAEAAVPPPTLAAKPRRAPTQRGAART